MKNPDTLWKSSINKRPASSGHKCPQKPFRPRSAVGHGRRFTERHLPPAPHHPAFLWLPGRYDRRVMGSQVTNRVSIVHERPLPYKALQQRLLGAGERGFKGALLGRIFSARAGEGLFLPAQPRVAGRAEPAVRGRDGAAGCRQGGGARPCPAAGSGARAPSSPAPPTGACSVNHDGNFSLAS